MFKLIVVVVVVVVVVVDVVFLCGCSCCGCFVFVCCFRGAPGAGAVKAFIGVDRGREHSGVARAQTRTRGVIKFEQCLNARARV